MNFLLKRPTPKNIDLTYEWMDEIQSGTTIAKANPSGLLTVNGMSANKNSIAQTFGKKEVNLKEAIARSKLGSSMKEIFILHGAVDLSIPIISPVQDSFTIFSSLRQQLYGADRKASSDGVPPQLNGELGDYKNTDSLATYLEIDYTTPQLLKVEKLRDKISWVALDNLGDVRQRITYLNVTQQTEQT